MYLIPEGGEEGSRQPVLTWAFQPIYVPHRILHLYHYKRSDNVGLNESMCVSTPRPCIAKLEGLGAPAGTGIYKNLSQSP